MNDFSATDNAVSAADSFAGVLQARIDAKENSWEETATEANPSKLYEAR